LQNKTGCKRERIARVNFTNGKNIGLRSADERGERASRTCAA